MATLVLAAAINAVSALRPGARVAVVGSRAFPALALVREFVAAVPAGVVVCSGAAAGVDRTAAAAARGRGLAVHELPAAWASLGRSAGVVRNAELVRSVDLVVVFLCCGSAGASSSIALARRAGVPCVVIPCSHVAAIDAPSLWS